MAAEVIFDIAPGTPVIPISRALFDSELPGLAPKILLHAGCAAVQRLWKKDQYMTMIETTRHWKWPESQSAIWTYQDPDTELRVCWRVVLLPKSKTWVGFFVKDEYVGDDLPF
jgi:hypothetical protein